MRKIERERERGRKRYKERKRKRQGKRERDGTRARYWLTGAYSPTTIRSQCILSFRIFTRSSHHSPTVRYITRPTKHKVLCSLSNNRFSQFSWAVSNAPIFSILWYALMLYTEEDMWIKQQERRREDGKRANEVKDNLRYGHIVMKRFKTHSFRLLSHIRTSGQNCWGRRWWLLGCKLTGLPVRIVSAAHEPWWATGLSHRQLSGQPRLPTNSSHGRGVRRSSGATSRARFRK